MITTLQGLMDAIFHETSRGYSVLAEFLNGRQLYLDSSWPESELTGLWWIGPNGEVKQT